MTRTEPPPFPPPTPRPFPRSDLEASQHQRMREFLVREASPRPAGAPAWSRRPGRRSLVIAVTALAVAAVIAGATVAATTWSGNDAPAPAGRTRTDPEYPNGWYLGDDGKKHAFTAQNPECSDSDSSHAPKEAPQVIYLAPEPDGYASGRGSLGMGLWCYDGRNPVISYLRPSSAGPAGTISAAVTVTRLADSPEKLAQWPNLRFRSQRVPRSEPVTVRSQQGRISADRVLTWQEPDGQYWTVTASGVRAQQLVAIADALTISGRAASWPQADEQGFQRLAVPDYQAQDHSRLPYWFLDYEKKGCSDCRFDATISWRTPPPWQAEVTGYTMPIRLVDVNGRQGVLAGRVLRADLGAGAQVWITETGTVHTDLLGYARALRLVAPDDPRVGPDDGTAETFPSAQP